MNVRILLWIVLLPATSMGQVQLHRILPSETQSNMKNVHSTHIARTPDTRTAKKKLLVCIVGTGGRAEGMAALDSFANGLGYHTISLDYENNVISTVCRTSVDSTCFDSFRQEIVFGTPVSDSVHVDSINSIYNRLHQALKTLASRFPSEGWESYLTANAINWSRITVCGHSQGAGHAAYFGKYFALDKVIAFAGPQDFSDVYQRPAPWIRKNGKTSPNRYFAFLHENDPFGFVKQQQCDYALTSTRKSAVVSSHESGFEQANVYFIQSESQNPHGSMMSTEYAAVWKMLLDR
jgi:hypothetical protein